MFVLSSRFFWFFWLERLVGGGGKGGCFEFFGGW